MKSARKLVLVDENDREYKRLQRRAEDVSKTTKSLQLSDTCLLYTSDAPDSQTDWNLWDS